MEWTQHVLEGEVLSIAADGDRFVAVGRIARAQGSWISTNGSEWGFVPVPAPTEAIELTPDIPPEFATLNSAMGALVRLDETLFSFGFYQSQDFIRPVGWRWPDGGQWETIVSSAEFYESGSVTDAVAGNGVMLAARQGIRYVSSNFLPDSTVWAWTLQDGWVQTNIIGGDEAQMVISDLAWNGTQFLAVGFKLLDSQRLLPQESVVWASADGLNWTELPPPSGQGQLCALEVDAEGRFLALGKELERSMMWTSADGSAWEGAELPGERVQEPSPNMLSIGRCDIVTISGHTVAAIHTDSGSNAWTRSLETDWVPGPHLPQLGGVIETGTYLASKDDTLVVVTHEYGTSQGTLSTIHVGTAAP